MANLALMEHCRVRTEKSCPQCKSIKPLSDFYKSKDSRNGTIKIHVASWCKSCSKANWKKQPKKYEYRRDRSLWHNYKITLADAKRMLDSQMGMCANRACGHPLSFDVAKGKKDKAHVDHCHSTGKVRGILCHTCNTSLGHLENKNRVLGLMEYLQKTTKTEH
ncbi:MAG: hypothetical protein KGL39_37400 [Patescibacteria group bacterium]|nr:hypothetical protein [Patescibacteria group bacterium]